MWVVEEQQKEELVTQPVKEDLTIPEPGYCWWQHVVVEMMVLLLLVLVLVLLVLDLVLGMKILVLCHAGEDQGESTKAKMMHQQWLQTLICTFSSWTQSCSCTESVSSVTWWSWLLMRHVLQHLPSHGP